MLVLGLIINPIIQHNPMKMTFYLGFVAFRSCNSKINNFMIIINIYITIKNHKYGMTHDLKMPCFSTTTFRFRPFVIHKSRHYFCLF